MRKKRLDTEATVMDDNTMIANTPGKYAAVTNIPGTFRAADLRAHFSSLVESESFICFHYRHRPEKGNSEPSANSKKSETTSSHDQSRTPKRCCCIVKVFEDKMNDFLKYSNQNWIDVQGEYHSDICEIAPIQVLLNENDQKSIEEDINSFKDAVQEKVLFQMPELKPPQHMAQGNVGTPTLLFLQLIQACLLPQSLVRKLNLEFPRTRSKRLYDSMDYQYDKDSTFKSSRFFVRNKASNSNSVQSRSLKTVTNVTNSPFSKQDIDQARHTSSESALATKTNNGNDSNETLSEEQSRSSSQVETEVPKSSRHDKELSGSSTSSQMRDAPHSSGQEKEHSISHFSSASTQNQAQDQSTSSISASEDGGSNVNTDSESRCVNRLTKAQRKADRRLTRKLMAEGIEERLIAIDRKYHNDEDAEEWDRHEASEDDPSNQERNKERLYEEEIEQPWEKGGPGVVFYTDAQFWQKREGDFDEQTTDDLDVDLSAYEEKGAGDMDIKDFLKIRQETRFRSGYDKTDRFSIGIGKKLKKPTYSRNSQEEQSGSGGDCSSSSETARLGRIGEFERHSKGIGRKVMESQGWREGESLGSSQVGITEALKGEGQRPHNKRGLGFVEPAPVHFGASASKTKRRNKFRQGESGLISTVFDNPPDIDPKEPLLQRSEPTVLKHRQSHIEAHEQGNK